MPNRLIASRRPLYFSAGAAAAATFTGPYDSIQTGIKGAWAVRRLFTSYTGSAIRLRRSSDNAESDFGFDSSGNLDTASIASWIGGGSGYLVTWYDQSGNSKDATQATTTQQPLYVASLLNSKPGFTFDSANLQQVQTPAPSSYFNFTHQTAATFAAVTTCNQLTVDAYMWAGMHTSATSGMRIYRAATTERLNVNCTRLTGPANGFSVQVTHTSGAITTPAYNFILLDPDNGTAANREVGYGQGVQLTGTNASSTAPAIENGSYAPYIGGRGVASQTWLGDIHEIMLWGDYYDGYRATWEASVVSYWGL